MGAPEADPPAVHLVGADLVGADLVGADLVGADLEAAARTIVTAAICFVDAGRVLGVRKTTSPRFQLPGGKLDPGETALDAALRETREEIGVDCDPASLTLLGSFTEVASNEPGWLVEATVWVGELAGQLPVPAAEIAEVRWLPLAEDTPPDVEVAPLLVRRVLPALRAHPSPRPVTRSTIPARVGGASDGSARVR